MNKFNYESAYAPYFKQFVDIKKRLGYVSLQTEWVFLEFDKFFITNNITIIGITREQVEQWRSTRINDAATTIYFKYCILIQFCKFMCKIGYSCYVPKQVSPPKNRFIPHIYSNQEMKNIFQACDNMRLYDKHMSSVLFTIPAVIRLLYGTGIRISEALALKNNDLDFTARTIIIKTSKNGQERVIPISDDLENVLQQYLYYRNRIAIPRISDTNGYFFVSSNGSNCLQNAVYKWFKKALAIADIPHIGDHQGPRIHDLRHTFAVHALAQMAQAGLDLYFALPILSTFLGHKSLDATDHYVRLTSEMYPDLLKDENNVCAFVFPKTNVLKA